MLLALAVACLAGGCSKRATSSRPELTGSITVDGAAAALVRCRPGHAVHVFVEVDTALGVLRFGEGKLSWDGNELTCQKVDRRWGGGVRRDGSAYFRGTLAFRCGELEGDLALDCGQITADEAAQLDHNQAAARGSGSAAAPATPGSDHPDGR